MFEGVRKWFAVRGYAKGLGPKLKERYGEQKQYTPAQVKRTAEEGGYSADYLCFALCMYCGPAEFADYHRTTGEACDYDAMRSEVADRFFSGFLRLLRHLLMRLGRGRCAVRAAIVGIDRGSRCRGRLRDCHVRE